MAPRDVPYLLVGGGMASANCVAELRARGAEGEIVLAGREADPPYERPPLSKEYLRGESSREDAFVQPEAWYADNGVELRTGTSVTGIDAETRIAKFQGGEEIRFEKALLATGANVNILRPEGAELDGIYYLRAYGNADSIREAAAGADRVVLIGGSYIGCEVAASLTATGTECAIVMLEDVALSRTFGEEVGRYFHDQLIANGVEIHGGESLAAFEGDGSVNGVRTESGTLIEGDCVVIGAGVKPDVVLAGRAGLDVDDGVTCDRTLQSSVEGIYAAGDCCSYDSVVHRRRLRVEHWDVAMQQGRHAAGAMLGSEDPYEVVPYFFSDLADWASLEYVGPAREWDEVVFRGTPDSGEFSAWYLQDGKVAAALSVGRSEDLGHARRLLAAGVDVSAAVSAFSDPDTDLESVG